MCVQRLRLSDGNDRSSQTTQLHNRRGEVLSLSFYFFIFIIINVFNFQVVKCERNHLCVIRSLVCLFFKLRIKNWGLKKMWGFFCHSCLLSAFFLLILC